MVKEQKTIKRELRSVQLYTELAIVGGGVSGVCTAITAARKGVKVVLVQDRPVLGGNASSEVRLWILGATSHMGNNNRWSREGGVIDEVLVENTYINKEGNPLIFDALLLDKVRAEPNITLLLNTAIYEINKAGDDLIGSVKGFCSQNSTEYTIYAPLFCDSSGDGIVGFLSGAAFRMGAESAEEFGEKFAPTKEYGGLLGHSMYFYTKDIGRPVKYSAPGFSIDVTKEVPKFRQFNAKEHGCQLWWLEHGGRMDTVHDTEEIKWDLWKVIYGAWDYIKNSGQYPEAENLTLEWVGTIPGKRESRRFEGDYMMRQQDIVEQRVHKDAVAYGGWSIDLHPADGIFSEKPGCNQWHTKGIYQIPFRSLYSKNIQNLFLGGRIISASHVAFASTRVMATAAHIGQAIGMAAYIAKDKASQMVERAMAEVYNFDYSNRNNPVHDTSPRGSYERTYLTPREIVTEGFIAELQRELLKVGQHIPGLMLEDELDLVQQSQVSSSSVKELKKLAVDFYRVLDISMAQMLPLKKGRIPSVTFYVQVLKDTTLKIELRVSSKSTNYTPDIMLDHQIIELKSGVQSFSVAFNTEMPVDNYAFIILHKNKDIKVGCTEERLTGILSVFNTVNKAVSNFGKQTPPEDIGMETFEFWCPERRPEGHNLAFALGTALRAFDVDNIKMGIYRPTTAPNAWVADLEDPYPYLELIWSEPQAINYIDLFFDTDSDHAMESVFMGHPEDVMPFCVRSYKIIDDKGIVVFEKNNNYQTLNRITLENTLISKSLKVFVQHPSVHVPAALFSVRCYN